MASMNQTRPYCIHEMGKTHSKPLVARHGRGKGHSMLCVWISLNWDSPESHPKEGIRQSERGEGLKSRMKV